MTVQGDSRDVQVTDTRPESGVAYQSRKGALLGKGSGIKSTEQARRVVAALRSERNVAR